MTSSVIGCHPDDTANSVMEKMSEGRFRHMPVVEHGRLAGLVSIGDVVKARMMEQEAEVDGLRAYVAGNTVAHLEMMQAMAGQHDALG